MKDKLQATLAATLARSFQAALGLLVCGISKKNINQVIHNNRNLMGSNSDKIVKSL